MLRSLKDCWIILIQERAHSQLPQVIATYQAGIPVIFGRVTLTQRGIEVDQGKKRLFWPEVSSVEVTDQQVSIHSRRETIWSWQRLPRWTVPNAPLLQELTANLLQAQQQLSQSSASAEVGELP